MHLRYLGVTPEVHLCHTCVTFAPVSHIICHTCTWVSSPGCHLRYLVPRRVWNAIAFLTAKGIMSGLCAYANINKLHLYLILWEILHDSGFQHSLKRELYLIGLLSVAAADSAYSQLSRADWVINLTKFDNCLHNMTAGCGWLQTSKLSESKS